MRKTHNAFFLKYGAAGRRLYGVWCTMWGRCRNKNHGSYRLYGARGITVSDEWRSFDMFFNDMGIPQPGESLERKDNDQGYNKANVVWADKKTQANNNRRNRLVTAFGEQKTLAQWSEDPRCASNYPCLYYRVIRAGWDPELAILSAQYDIKHQPHKGTTP